MIKSALSKLIVIATILSFLIFAIFDAAPQQFITQKHTYAQKWLGAPLTVQTPNQWEHPFAEQAASVSLKLGAMLFHSGNAQLVNLQLIDEQYPVSGDLQISNQAPLIENGIYIDQSFAEQSGIQLGDTVTIFETNFQVTSFIISQDEQIFSPQSFSPTVIIPFNQLSTIGIENIGFRASWYYYYNDPTLINEIKKSALPGIKVLTYNDQLGRLGRITQQAENLLLNFQVMAAILAGTILYLVLSYYHKELSSPCAIMKILGIRTRKRIALTIRPLIKAAITGMILSSVSLILLIFVLTPKINTSGLSIHTFSLLQRSWLTTSLYILILTALLQLQLQTADTLKQIRSYNSNNLALPILFLIILFATATALSNWSAADLLPAVTTIATACLTLYMFSRSLVYSFQVLAKYPHKYALVLLNRLRLSPHDTSMMLLAVCVLIYVTLGIWHARYQTIPSWQQSLPENTPNFFLLGIADDDIVALESQYPWFAAATKFRVVRGQLTHINNIAAQTYQDGAYKHHEALNRQLNLTHFDQLPPFNNIIEGAFGEGVSAEKGIMERLNLKIGDTLTFEIMGDAISLPITNTREVKWQSFQANFYFSLPKNILQKYPASYLTSIYISKDQRAQLYQMIKDNPHIIYINISDYIQTAQQFLHTITAMITFVFSMVTAAIAVSIITLLYRQLQQRRAEWKIYRRLSIDIQKSLTLEMLLLLTISTIISTGLFYGTIQLVNQQQLFAWHFDAMSYLTVIPIWLLTLTFSLYYDRTVTMQKIRNNAPSQQP